MKFVEIAVAVAVAATAIAVIVFVFRRGDEGSGAQTVVVVPLRTPDPAAAPTSDIPSHDTWIDGLATRSANSPAVLLSCLDTGDGTLTQDDPGVPAGVHIALAPGSACSTNGVRAEWYVGAPSLPEPDCAVGPAPLRIVAIGGGGTDLLDASLGESTGFLPIVNAIQQRATSAGVSTAITLSAAAVFDAATNAQEAMERWLDAWLADQLARTPCLRAVLLGHSHGGVSVTQVTSALDDRYGDRMLGVLLDRTIALYDRPVDDWPARTPILNYFQLNEGWHGIPIDRPNVTNFDQSAETAPVPSAGGEGAPGIVDHTTLDDAPATQQRIVDAVVAWAVQP